MARILKNFDWGDDYPWKEWTDGQTRIAIQNIDYHTTTAAFKSELHKHAKTLNGIKVRTKSDTRKDGTLDAVIFQFYKERKKRISKPKTKTVEKIEVDPNFAPYGLKKDGTPRKKPGRKSVTEKVAPKAPEPVKDPTSGEKQTSGKDSTTSDTDAAIIPGDRPVSYSTQSEGF